MGPHDLNIRHLAALAAVAASGSVSAAARAVHLTQPAVTQGIAKLERQFGQALFVRRAGGMEPTEAGRLLAARAEAMLRLMGTRRITAAQVRAFLALAQAGSYPAAAAATGLAEASLHRAVADLSVALGAILVERRGRGLALTPRGRETARRLTLATAEVGSALVELAALAGRETGRLAIGAMPLARARLLPDAVIAFHRDHPQVDIAIVEGSHAELIGPLRDGQIDMMIGALRPDAEPDLHAAELFRDTPVIVARADHPLAGAPDPSGAVLADFPWVVSGERTPLRDLWTRMFATFGMPPPRVAIECGSVMMVRQILVGSDSLALLSRDQLAVELEAGWLAAIGAAPAALERIIGVTTRIDWRATPLQARFLDHLAAAGQAIAAGVRKN